VAERLIVCPTPVPLTAIDWVAAAAFRALSVRTALPLLVPAMVGIKFKDTSQLAP